jgi:hypothetical protein
MNIEILNLNYIDNNYHIRYIKNHNIVKNIITTLEHNNNYSKYKLFKYTSRFKEPIKHITNELLNKEEAKYVYEAIIESFAKSASLTLFEKNSLINLSFNRYCQGGYMNILYIKNNYDLNAKAVFLFNIIEIFDTLYPFKENRLYEIFDNLEFYRDIIQTTHPL